MLHIFSPANLEVWGVFYIVHLLYTAVLFLLWLRLSVSALFLGSGKTIREPNLSKFRLIQFSRTLA